MSTGTITVTNPMESTEDCTCTGHCISCDDPGVYHACRLHEDVHCKYDMAMCNKIKDNHQLYEAALDWSEYYANFGELIRQEIEAYKDSIPDLCATLNNKKCYPLEVGGSYSPKNLDKCTTAEIPVEFVTEFAVLQE